MGFLFTQRSALLHGQPGCGPRRGLGVVECRTASGLELRYMARWESPELRFGIGSRSIVSGTFEVAQTF